MSAQTENTLLAIHPKTNPNPNPPTITPQTLTVQTITATDIAPAQIMSTSDVNVNFKLTADGTTANIDQSLIKSIIENYFSEKDCCNIHR